MKNDIQYIKELEDSLNRIHSLAVTFYAMMGYIHRDDHCKLYDSQHPTELLMWDMACAAYEDIDGLNGLEILDELRSLKE